MEQRAVLRPYLHGLEDTILGSFPDKKRINGKYQNWKPQVVRYADDFVILHPDKTVIEECKNIASKWLAELDLELKPSKTRITHTFETIEGNETSGFDFLGFYIRSYPVGKTHCGKNNGIKLGFKTLIKPTKAKVKLHYQNLASYIEEMKGAPQERLMRDLNPAIIGWSNYYSTSASKETFSWLDMMIFRKLFSWAKFRHPKKSKHWIASKYWLINQGRGWTFGTEKLTLAKHANIGIKRHVKVKGISSPYDGNWTYWSQRRGSYPGISQTVASALKRQKGKCLECGLYFHLDDQVEIHHLDGNYRNRQKENLTALHRHCHDQTHGNKGNLSTQLSTHAKGQLGEEPDERKLCAVVRTD